MSVATNLTGEALAKQYRDALDERRAQGFRGLDEAFAPDGALRSGEVWEDLDQMGLGGLLTRRREIERWAHTEGIAAGSTTLWGHWRIDPIPLVFDTDEWRTLQAGLQQRARLLDAILVDLYGERRLFKERLLPADLFLGHDGYLLPAVGVTMPGPRQLPIAGVDLAHGPDGWVVITDRTQAPSGIGYALANRRLVSRVMEPLFRTTRTHRLRSFFEVLQLALHRAAPKGVASPRTVLLSPGPGSDTAYDQSLIATMLGHPIVQADDLEIRDGKLWMRTPRGGQRVHVVHRRVDGAWVDPLELRPGSELGVTGLLAAARRGTVSVVNPIGSGVLENVGMAPYLQEVSRALLDEDLQLTSPQTWWCGDRASRQHVLANLDQLVIRPNSRSERPTVILGHELDRQERDDLAARIEAQPWAWSAQELVPNSTAPVVTRDGLSPRALAFRAFRVAVEDDYVVMPGGLAKVARSADDEVVRNARGVINKDVWVLESAQAPVWSTLKILSGTEDVELPTPALTPRAASDLYWLGRYGERLEGTARLASIADNLITDQLSRPGTAGHVAMQTIVGAIGQMTGAFVAPGDEEDAAERHDAMIRTLLLDETHVGSVAFAAMRTVANVIGVRELLSDETVGIVGEVIDSLEAADPESGDLHPQGVASAMVRSCLALAGVAAESVPRDETWTYMDAGRRLERAQATVTLLRHTIAEPFAPVAESVVIEMVLRVCDSLGIYRRRLAAGVGSAHPVVALVEVLLEDAANPRSLRYQLDRLVEHYGSDDVARIREAADDLRGLLSEIDHDAIITDDPAALAGCLEEINEQLRGLSVAIEETKFAPQQAHRSFAVQEWSER